MLKEITTYGRFNITNDSVWKNNGFFFFLVCIYSKLCNLYTILKFYKDSKHSLKKIIYMYVRTHVLNLYQYLKTVFQTKILDLVLLIALLARKVEISLLSFNLSLLRRKQIEKLFTSFEWACIHTMKRDCMSRHLAQKEKKRFFFFMSRPN